MGEVAGPGLPWRLRFLIVCSDTTRYVTVHDLLGVLRITMVIWSPSMGESGVCLGKRQFWAEHGHGLYARGWCYGRLVERQEEGNWKERYSRKEHVYISLNYPKSAIVCFWLTRK